MASAQPDAQINVYVGVDFGTTYSCLAYSLDDPNHITRYASDTGPIASIGGVCPQKIPSRLWLHQDGSFASWGSDKLSSEHSLVELVKIMLLHDDDAREFMDSDWFVGAKSNVRRLRQNAAKVTTMYLESLWSSFRQALSSICTKECRIHVTFTVPADWPDDARTRMLGAIEAAGIRNSTQTPVNFISEPEAVTISLLPRELHRINPKENDALIICDCGGGTVDCIGLQICGLSPLKVSECTLGESILAGAAILVNAFRERFIAKLRASCPGVQLNEEVVEEIEDLISSNLNRVIERYDGSDEKREISLPAWIIGSQARRSRAGSSQQIMAFTKEDMEQIFKPVHRITELVKSQIKAVKAKIGQFPKAVIVAGGFGKNYFLQIAINQMVKDNFDGSVNVIQYNDNIGWLSVAHGALQHAIETGRKVQGPAMVARRMSRHRYGFRQANQGVKWFLEKGASISTEEANAFQIEPKDFQVLLSMGRKYLTLEIYSQSGKTSLVQRTCVVKWLQEQEPRSPDSFHLGLVHDGMSATFTLYVDGHLQGPGQVNFEYGY